jgi:hypothetical protein
MKKKTFWERVKAMFGDSDEEPSADEIVMRVVEFNEPGGLSGQAMDNLDLSGGGADMDFDWN